MVQKTSLDYVVNNFLGNFSDLGKRVSCNKKLVLSCTIKNNKRIWKLKRLNIIDFICIALFGRCCKLSKRIRLDYILNNMKAELAGKTIEKNTPMHAMLVRIQGCFDRKYKKSKTFPVHYTLKEHHTPAPLVQKQTAITPPSPQKDPQPVQEPKKPVIPPDPTPQQEKPQEKPPVKPPQQDKPQTPPPQPENIPPPPLQQKEPTQPIAVVTPPPPPVDPDSHGGLVAEDIRKAFSNDACCPEDALWVDFLRKRHPECAKNPELICSDLAAILNVYDTQETEQWSIRKSTCDYGWKEVGLILDLFVLKEFIAYWSESVLEFGINFNANASIRQTNPPLQRNKNVLTNQMQFMVNNYFDPEKLFNQYQLSDIPEKDPQEDKLYFNDILKHFNSRVEAGICDLENNHDPSLERVLAFLKSYGYIKDYQAIFDIYSIKQSIRVTFYDDDRGVRQRKKLKRRFRKKKTLKAEPKQPPCTEPETESSPSASGELKKAASASIERDVEDIEKLFDPSSDCSEIRRKWAINIVRIHGSESFDEVKGLYREVLILDKEHEAEGSFRIEKDQFSESNPDIVSAVLDYAVLTKYVVSWKDCDTCYRLRHSPPLTNTDHRTLTVVTKDVELKHMITLNPQQVCDEYRATDIPGKQEEQDIAALTFLVDQFNRREDRDTYHWNVEDKHVQSSLRVAKFLDEKQYVNSYIQIYGQNLRPRIQFSF